MRLRCQPRRRTRTGTFLARTLAPALATALAPSFAPDFHNRTCTCTHPLPQATSGYGHGQHKRTPWHRLPAWVRLRPQAHHPQLRSRDMKQANSCGRLTDFSTASFRPFARSTELRAPASRPTCRIASLLSSNKPLSPKTRCASSRSARAYRTQSRMRLLLEPRPPEQAIRTTTRPLMVMPSRRRICHNPYPSQPTSRVTAASLALPIGPP